MTGYCNSRDRDDALYPQTPGDQQVKRHKDGNGRSAEIDRYQGSRPFDIYRDHVTHSQKGYLLLRQSLPRGELHDRDIEVAPDKGANQD